ncbi:ceramide-1-phosphate transfer protein-like [Pocillopora verrucosa]|uniref:ceramide-1-phosphate transfer protein-like n=1 Tax=Pocillopora verrucosa TaxID=203993 RepID=UPI00279704AD|nr:ceramide-1-phosphate transfer protein-like [Pocillopora verrucosa]
MTERKFELAIVLDAFKKTLQEDGSLVMDEYIRGYGELCIFFDMLGTVFGFITSDVREKMGILQDYRKSKHGEKYVFIQAMLDFEIENDLTRKTTHPLSGSRTLLRLHRALAFTMLFMSKLSQSTDDDSSYYMAKDAYNESLANFHPWIIRKAALWAMYTLPKVGDFIKKIAQPNMDKGKTKQLLKEVSDAMKQVYDFTEELYTKHNLHDLP